MKWNIQSTAATKWSRVGVSKKKHLCNCLILQTCILNRHFLKTKQSKPVTSRKTITGFIAYDKIASFKQKLEWCKICIHHCEFDGFSILKGFSNDIKGDINECDFKILSNEAYHLEDLHNSLNHNVTRARYYKIMHRQKSYAE